MAQDELLPVKSPLTRLAYMIYEPLRTLRHKDLSRDCSYPKRLPVSSGIKVLLRGPTDAPRSFLGCILMTISQYLVCVLSCNVRL